MRRKEGGLGESHEMCDAVAFEGCGAGLRLSCSLRHSRCESLATKYDSRDWAVISG